MNDQDTITKVIAEMRELEADYTERALVREWADRLAALDGWRPILTAPEDREILLLADVVIGPMLAVQGCWCSDGEWIDVNGDMFQATHWMPLPAPPKGAEE